MYNRKIDCLGRITIPKDIREALDMPHGTNVTMNYQDNMLIIQKKDNNPFKKIEKDIMSLEDSKLKDELLLVLATYTNL